ncbi:MAG TPA: hypothetical protein PK691_10515 [Thermomicrobiales bacterium]|nr:hypothetical protein [Thermomicrobiales bacterium]HRA48759.1 hypothetical protein [Thermomicrobiales bacterium]
MTTQMRTRVVLLLALSCLLGTGTQITAAQSPVIPIVDPDGTVVGNIEVVAWSDSGAAANPTGTCCQIGYAPMTVTINAISDLTVDLATFWAFDTANQKAVTKMPDRGTPATGIVEVPAGTSTSISVVFLTQSLGYTDGGTHVARVVWQRGTTNLIRLISEIDPIPPGTEVIIHVSDERLLGTMTVIALNDPLTEIRQSAMAPKGQRTIGLTIAITVGPEEDLSITQYDFILVDEEGRIWEANDEVIRLNRVRHGVPDLNQTTLIGPGESWTGFLGFRVPEDAGITDVYYRALPQSYNGLLQPIVHIEAAD